MIIRPASLQGLFVNRDLQIDSRNDFALELEPNEEEARILELFDQKQSISAIAEKVYGSKGGKQNDKVKAALERFGRVYQV